MIVDELGGDQNGEGVPRSGQVADESRLDGELAGDCPPHMDYQDDVKYEISCKQAWD